LNANDDPVLIAAYEPLVGRTIGDLDPDPGAPRPKQYRRLVVDAAVRASDSTAAEVWDRNKPRIKTIPVDDELFPYEAVSFPAFTVADLLNESWLTATFGTEVESLLLLPIRGPGGLDAADAGILLPAVPWSPSASELEAMGREWQGFVDEIRATGQHTSTASGTSFIHIRPHAADSTDTDPTSDGVVRSSFWLNKELVQRILRGEVG
jgi:DNA mismatch repair protein MutH